MEVQLQYAVLGYVGYKVYALSRLPDAVQNNDDDVKKEEETNGAGNRRPDEKEDASRTDEEKQAGVVELVEETEKTEWRDVQDNAPSSSLWSVFLSSEHGTVKSCVGDTSEEFRTCPPSRFGRQRFGLPMVEVEEDDDGALIETVFWSEQENRSITVEGRPESMMSNDACSTSEKRSQSQQTRYRSVATQVLPSALEREYRSTAERLHSITSESSHLETVRETSSGTEDDYDGQRERERRRSENLIEDFVASLHDDDLLGTCAEIEPEAKPEAEAKSEAEAEIEPEAEPEAEPEPDVEPKPIADQCDRDKKKITVFPRAIATESAGGTEQLGGGDKLRISGKVANNTHREALPASDDLWTPWPKPSIRRPKPTKQPWIAFKSAMWWRVRAEMPHLETHRAVMKEVTRRWHDMPDEAKQVFKASVALQAVRAVAHTGRFVGNQIREAEQRLRLLSIPHGQEEVPFARAEE